MVPLSRHQSLAISQHCWNLFENLSRLNRIQRTVTYMRPIKLQASLRAHDLMQKHELVDVFATMRGNFYSRKLERTSNADRLKVNGRLVQINLNLIGSAIVAFVRS